MLLSLQIPAFLCVSLPNLLNFYTFGYFEHSLFRLKSLVPCVFQIKDDYCNYL